MRRVLVLALGMFALGTDAFIVAGLIPRIAGDVHASESAVGQLVTAFTLSYAVSGPLLSSAVTRLSTKRMLLVALLVFTVGNVVTAVAGSLVLLLVGRVVAGVGAGVFSPLAAATAAGLVPAERRGRALSVILAGLSVGTVLGVPAGLFLARTEGWQTAIWLLVAIGVLAMIGVARVLPHVKVPTAPSARARFATLADRRVAPVVLVSLLVNIASLGLYTYLAPVLRDSAGLTDPTLYLWIWGIGGIAGALAIGPVLDRVRRTSRVMLTVLAMFVVGIVALVPAGGALPIVAVALAVWGAAGFSSPPPQQHLLLDRAGDRGTIAVAMNASAIYLGSAIGSSLGGIALHAGLAARDLPFAAAGIAALATVCYGLFVARDQPTVHRAAAPDHSPVSS